jgi:hypothetical protein
LSFGSARYQTVAYSTQSPERLRFLWLLRELVPAGSDNWRQVGGALVIHKNLSHA